MLDMLEVDALAARVGVGVSTLAWLDCPYSWWVQGRALYDVGAMMMPC